MLQRCTPVRHGELLNSSFSFWNFSQLFWRQKCNCKPARVVCARTAEETVKTPVCFSLCYFVFAWAGRWNFWIPCPLRCFCSVFRRAEREERAGDKKDNWAVPTDRNIERRKRLELQEKWIGGLQRHRIRPQKENHLGKEKQHWTVLLVRPGKNCSKKNRSLSVVLKTFRPPLPTTPPILLSLSAWTLIPSKISSETFQNFWPGKFSHFWTRRTCVEPPRHPSIGKSWRRTTWCGERDAKRLDSSLRPSPLRGMKMVPATLVQCSNPCISDTRR